jgi:NAD(P)-dependent dehydrogenase (short-subunit alcohol dehydrogenase family)
MQGRTVLVTGATQGIGKATAAALAAQGARVVVVARTEERGRAAVAEIAAEARSGGSADLIVADFASLAQVRAAAATFKAKYDRLDVLINNAGVLVPMHRTTADGIEETFAINHLAPFVLTHELLDILRATAPARIVNVSSEAHRHAKMHWEDLQFARSPYSAWAAYRQSKLANLLFTYELARRLEVSRVTANALHPGVIASGFGQTYGGPLSLIIKLAHPFMATAEQGAKTSVHLAASPEVSAVSGAYFAKGTATKSNPVSYCRASQEKLWALSLELTRAPSLRSGVQPKPDVVARPDEPKEAGNGHGQDAAAYGGAFSRLS